MEKNILRELFKIAGPDDMPLKRGYDIPAITRIVNNPEPLKHVTFKILSTKDFVNKVLIKLKANGVNLSCDQVKAVQTSVGNIRLFFTSNKDKLLHEHLLHGIGITYMNENDIEEASAAILKEWS